MIGLGVLAAMLLFALAGIGVTVWLVRLMLRPIAGRVPSRIFTMDVAFLDDGGWTIVELGDGQVAGLPDPHLAPAFFPRCAAAPAR